MLPLFLGRDTEVVRQPAKSEMVLFVDKFLKSRMNISLLKSCWRLFQQKFSWASFRHRNTRI